MKHIVAIFFLAISFSGLTIEALDSAEREQTAAVRATTITTEIFTKLTVGTVAMMYIVLTDLQDASGPRVVLPIMTLGSGLAFLASAGQDFVETFF